MKVNLMEELKMLKQQLAQVNDKVSSLEYILFGKYDHKEVSNFLYLERTNEIHITDNIGNYPSYLITFSHDPKTIGLTDDTQMINYYLSSLDDVLIELSIDSTKYYSIDGVFEKNKHRQIHCHFILTCYDSSLPHKIEQLMKPRLTHRMHLRASTDVRKCTDIEGVYQYIQKQPVIYFQNKRTKPTYDTDYCSLDLI